MMNKCKVKVSTKTENESEIYTIECYAVGVNGVVRISGDSSNIIRITTYNKEIFDSYSMGQEYELSITSNRD